MIEDMGDIEYSVFAGEVCTKAVMFRYHALHLERTFQNSLCNKYLNAASRHVLSFVTGVES